MNTRVTVGTDGETITVHIPMTFRKRGGRKLVVTPDGALWTPPRAHIDSAMVKAVARAFRWRTLLEGGDHASIRDIAAAEHLNPSYISRVLRLTLLDPATVEAILDGRQGPQVTLAALMKPFPPEWQKQQF